MKENKYYTHVNFFLPFAYVMILGFFFTENTDKVFDLIICYCSIDIYKKFTLNSGDKCK